MTDIEVEALFDSIYNAFRSDEWSAGNGPLLAHYTSMANSEKIIREERILLSNPLFMNDIEEMRFGLNVGRDLIVNTFTPLGRIFEELGKEFLKIYQDFDNNLAINTYVFCLSEHDPKDTDGRLSMWRAYGGNGSGAALIFDLGKIRPNNNSPLLITKVKYASVDERYKWIDKKIRDVESIIKKKRCSFG